LIDMRIMNKRDKVKDFLMDNNSNDKGH